MMLQNVKLNINFIKLDTGVPTNDVGLTDGEICLNTFDNQYYVANAGVWGVGQDFSLKSGIFKTDGGVAIAGITETHDNKIYRGDDIANPHVAVLNDITLVQDENTPLGNMYKFDGVNWNIHARTGVSILTHIHK
jgi:hypothetical protein